MAFSINADFWIKDFTEAEAKYASVKPIRGNNDDIRPIGNRRAQHIRILKYDNDTYACRLYHTDVATFHRDGRIVYSTGGWDTTSTAEFMSACMPRGWGASKRHNVIQAYNANKLASYIVGKNFTINTKTDTVSGYITPTKQVVNREASKAKREPFKPFLAFAQTFMETLNMEVPKDNDKFYDIRRLMYQFLSEPQVVPEEEYLNVLSGLTYPNLWSNHRHTFAQVKSKIYRENTVYDTVDLPIGSLQK